MWVKLNKFRRKLPGNLLPYLKRRFVDACTHVGVAVRPYRAELLLHSRQRFRDNTPNGAAPARMNGRHRPVVCIVDQNGHTVGNGHANEQPRPIGDEGVIAIVSTGRHSVQNVGAMNLV